MSERKLKLDISLSVLEDLGLRLYSSAPAVLSEIVANAWDADADSVSIQIDSDDQQIVIEDDGEGMGFEDALRHYLTVGYRRREHQPTTTAKHGRKVMGRKGIGKLAPLAIADEVEIETRKDCRKLRFLLDVGKIREDIKANRSHEPAILEDGDTDEASGTKIILRKLKRRVQWSIAPLRKRLALRFAVLGPAYNFEVSVNRLPLNEGDIDYYKRIELAWAYGLKPEDPNRKKLTSEAEWEDRPSDITLLVDEELRAFGFSGWLGTTFHPSDLEDNGQSFGAVLVFVRGKLAHENATALVNDDHLFTKYLVGEIHADFLDIDTSEDIATSSRQGLIESDPRVEALRNFLKREFKHINKKWSERRAEKGGLAVGDIPAVKQYLDGLKTEPRRKAQRFLGKIWSGRDIFDNTPELVKSGILFCENLRVQESLDRLDRIDAADFAGIHEAFEFVNSLEATQYHQLVQARIRVIEAFQRIVGDNEKERVLQMHIANNLWLLNPSWDVVPTVGAMEVEKSLGSLAAKLKGTGSQEEKDSRLDIFYSKTSTTHVIIELKRYGARPTTDVLLDQVNRYRNEVRDILDTAGRQKEGVEVFVLLGKHPARDPRDEGRVNSQMAEEDAKIVLYDELIDDAQELHRGYLEITRSSQKMKSIMDSVDGDVTLALKPH